MDGFIASALDGLMVFWLDGLTVFRSDGFPLRTVFRSGRFDGLTVFRSDGFPLRTMFRTVFRSGWFLVGWFDGFPLGRFSAPDGFPFWTV